MLMIKKYLYFLIAILFFGLGYWANNNFSITENAIKNDFEHTLWKKESIVITESKWL